MRIRSANDAHQVFYAVARNILPLIVRRLDVEERRAIVSGNIYVWEERGSTSEAAGLGMERWYGNLATYSVSSTHATSLSGQMGWGGGQVESAMY